MRILLDTHTLLWFVLGDLKLCRKARAEIESSANEKVVSPASDWEIAVKISIGKYTLPQSYEQFMRKAIDDNGFVILPILPCHTSALTNLPFHHRDPFDRLMIAQSIVEQMPIVSGDREMAAYPVACIW